MKLADFVTNFHHEDKIMSNKAWWQLDRKFVVDSKYQIKFTIAFTVPEIQHDLQTPLFAVFGQNLNFVDEYLENRIFAEHAVFAGCSQTLCTIVFNQKKMEVHGQISRKCRKTTQKCTFLYFMDEPNFFLKIGLRHFSRFIEG